MKWEIVGLKGRYCWDCTRSLRDFRLTRYSIIVMCRECLHAFILNGDLSRVDQLLRTQEVRMSDLESAAENARTKALGHPSKSRFDYIKYDEKSTEKQETFKNLFEDVEEFAMLNLADSRERSLLLTVLEEAYCWVGKAIRNEQLERSINTEHVPQRSNA